MAAREIGSNGAPSELRNAYFLSLELVDVRAFRGAHTLDLRGADGGAARWTLILGDNGVGKTTLLQVLALSTPAADQWTSGRAALMRLIYRALVPAVVRMGSAVAQWRVRIRWAESFDDHDGVEDGAYATAHRDGFDVSAFGMHTGSAAYGYGANRRQAAPGLTADAARDATQTLFDDESTLRNPEEWLLQTALAAASESPAQARANRQFSRVTELLTRILPDVRDIRVTTTAEKGEPIRSFVEVETLDGWVPYAALGLGYRTMTAWMVDLASRLFERYEHLEDPLSGAAVCLVDEIDLHLHPRWQRTLIDHLTKLFPNTQFIATAHSPLIVQSAADANVVLLRREGDHVVIDNEPQSVHGWRLDQILTSDLFGLPSARAPDVEAAIRERDALLGKRDPTADEKSRLAELQTRLDEIPYGDTPEDVKAMDIIRRAAKSLRPTEP